MRCDHIGVLISKQQSESLTPRESAEVSRHLETCVHCRAEQAMVTQAAATLREAGAAAGIAGPFIRRPDTGELLSRSQRRVNRPAYRRPALAVGVAVGVVTAALLVVNRSVSRNPTGPSVVTAKDDRRAPVLNSIDGDEGNRLAPAVQPGPAPTGSGGSRSLAGGSSTVRTPKPGVPSGVVQPVAAPPGDDLAYLNPPPIPGTSGWPSDEIRRREAELQRSVAGGDDFVSIPVPPIASRNMLPAIQAYQKEKTIVDPRLVRKMSLAVKGLSLSELCGRFSEATGVTLTANRRVADDKITIFCKERPLRDLMRQVGALLDFTWIRSGIEGAYEYELTQSLRSQIMEETLRQKDRDEMLLALDRQMESQRDFLGLSRSELGERMKLLTPRIQDKGVFEEYNRLSMLEQGGLAGANLFFRLSPAEMTDLRNGQELSWDLSGGANPGLPASILPGLSEALLRTSPEDRHGLPSVEKLTISLKLDMKSPGEYKLVAGIFGQGGGQGFGRSCPVAYTKSPSREPLDNAKANAALAKEPSLQGQIALKLQETCKLEVPPYPDSDGIFIGSGGPKVTTADVLEAFHKATGRDVVGDHFSMLHDPNVGSGGRLFDALNKTADAVRLRWTMGEGWLRFRSPDFYYARPQEVPSRLYERWAKARKEKKLLTPDELIEIGQLTDAQLDSVGAGQVAVACHGLKEWQVARIKEGRVHWRFLGQLSRIQLPEALGERGIAFTSLSKTMQRQYLELARLDESGVWPSASEMRTARMRVIYRPDHLRTEESRANEGVLPPGNTAVFLYSYGEPARYAAAGPFNGIYGLSQQMLDNRLKGAK